MNGVIVWEIFINCLKLWKVFWSFFFCGRERWSRRHWVRSKCLEQTIGERQVFTAIDIEHVCYKGSRQKIFSLDKVLKFGSWRGEISQKSPRCLECGHKFKFFFFQNQNCTDNPMFKWKVVLLWEWYCCHYPILAAALRGRWTRSASSQVGRNQLLCWYLLGRSGDCICICTYLLICMGVQVIVFGGNKKLWSPWNSNIKIT